MHGGELAGLPNSFTVNIKITFFQKIFVWQFFEIYNEDNANYIKKGIVIYLYRNSPSFGNLKRFWMPAVGQLRLQQRGQLRSPSQLQYPNVSYFFDLFLPIFFIQNIILSKKGNPKILSITKSMKNICGNISKLFYVTYNWTSRLLWIWMKILS